MLHCNTYNILLEHTNFLILFSCTNSSIISSCTNSHTGSSKPNIAFTLVSYHTLARFDTTRLSYHHGLNAHTTKPSQTKPAHRKLPCWHNSVWLGFLYSSRAINTKAEMDKRSIIKNARVHRFTLTGDDQIVMWISTAATSN